MSGRRIAAALTLSLLIGCSDDRPCQYARGTPRTSTQADTLLDYGHWTSGNEFQSCCDLDHPAADGGCAAICPEPRLERWVGFLSGSCQEGGTSGSWECFVVALDGGVESSFAVCLD